VPVGRRFSQRPRRVLLGDVADLAPLLTRGAVGYFVAVGGGRASWQITSSGYRQSRGRLSVAHPVQLREPVPVAVLTGPLTASAAEAVAIAFQAQPDTRRFGAATFGVPSGRALYRLADRAKLAITESRDADRTGHI
jgi:carboxyl-terminal processing protease